MESNTLKELMISKIKDYKEFDHSYNWGDYNARSFDSYENYLRSLSDGDFLMTYNEMKQFLDSID